MFMPAPTLGSCSRHHSNVNYVGCGVSLARRGDGREACVREQGRLHQWAGGGIGRATARLFARHGARLALVDIDEDSCGETAELSRLGGAPDALVGGGTIVNTSSIAGLSGNAGAMDYTAAKHGVVGLSKAAAIRYGRVGVRINVVCPGVIESPMTISGLDNTRGAREAIKRLSPILGTMGQPEDVGQAVLWLSSPLSRFVYGVALPVDGGFSIN